MSDTEIRPAREAAHYYRGDFDYVEEVRIVTHPRFKMSGLSGNEWRTSVAVQLLHKGEVFYERRFSRMKYAMAFLPWLEATLAEEPREYFRKPQFEDWDKGICQQPGCSEPATSRLMIGARSCDQCGTRNLPRYEGQPPRYVEFCQRHVDRGDSDLTDNNENLTPIGGLGALMNERRKSDESR